MKENDWTNDVKVSKGVIQLTGSIKEFAGSYYKVILWLIILVPYVMFIGIIMSSFILIQEVLHS